MNVVLNDDDVVSKDVAEVVKLVGDEVSEFDFIEVSGKTCDGTDTISEFCK